MRRVVAGALGLWLVASGCASSGGMGGGGGGSFGRRDERQLIGSYSRVFAVAVTRRLVFSATPSGIAIYDRLFNTWLPPMTRDNGFTDEQVTIVAGDPVEDAIWYGVPGAVVSYRPTTEQTQRTPITGLPDFIAFDRSGNGDAIVRAGGGWTRVSRTGFSTPLGGPPPAASLIVPRTLEDIYRQFPALRAGTGFLLRDQQADRPLRSYPVVSGAVTPERASEVWLGTDGDGLYRVDPTFQQATALRFGTIETGVGALAVAADGIWAGGLGVSTLRSGLTFATTDLQRWRWIEGTIAVPLIGVRTLSMSVRGPRVWLGTDRGVVRVRTDANDAMTRWSLLDGLPDDRVYAVAARSDPLLGEGAWVGTARGLVWVSDSAPDAGRDPRTRGIGERLLENTTVYALQPVGDTLWIGTNAGLVALPGGSRVLSRPVSSDPALRAPIRALAWSDSVLLAATDDAIVRLSPRSPSEPTRLFTLDARSVGGVTRLAIDERSIVVAGPDGVLIQARVGGIVRVLRVGQHLLAPVLDVALRGDWLWIATPAGLARFRRASDAGLP